MVVTATDPSGLFDTQQVTINVTDYDEDPVVTTTTRDTAVRFDENSTRSVATYRAADPEREAVTWSLSGFRRHGLQHQHQPECSASIHHRTTNNPPVRSATSISSPSWQLNLDTTLPINTGRLVVTVIVDDVDEPPVIRWFSRTFLYREDRTDLSVGVYRGTDPENAHVSDWRLTGSDSRHFEITDGELTFKEQPDYETRPNYRVTVHATDRTNHNGQPCSRHQRHRF